MSSRHQKEKRLRPQRDPYKRDHFDQSKYIRISSSSSKPDSMLNEENDQYDDLDYEDFE